MHFALVAKAKKKSSIPAWVKYILWSLLILFVVAETYENRRFFRKTYRYLTKSYYKKNFKPTDFPEDYPIHGIDISHYQLFVDWDKLKAVSTEGDTIHFKFVIVKATEGSFCDPVALCVVEKTRFIRANSGLSGAHLRRRSRLHFGHTLVHKCQTTSEQIT